MALAMNDKFWAIAAIAFSITALLSIIKLYYEYKLRKARKEAIKRYDPSRFRYDVWNCPRCKGRGSWQEAEPQELEAPCLDEMIDVNSPGMSVEIKTVKCSQCNGTGKQACKTPVYR